MEATAPATPPKRNPDWLLRASLGAVVVLYLTHLTGAGSHLGGVHHLAHSVFELVNLMWWGIALGIAMISIIGRIPREFVLSALGTGRGVRGIWRATVLGVLLDLCSHGVLMVGARLYERGASVGQLMAFLLSTPWNSFSFLLILFAMVGIGWTLAFMVLSMLIALLTGLAFDRLTRNGFVTENPNAATAPENFQFWPELKQLLAGADFSPASIARGLADGVRGSRMVMRWILFGIVLAAIIRAFVPADAFAAWFGPTLLGLAATIGAATIIEVCSEGSVPLAADLLNRASAPGNGFAFLMGGVVTDYTELLVLRETTGSLRITLLLPALALPQVLLVAWLMNQVGG